jgi:hypothetical protein
MELFYVAISCERVTKMVSTKKIHYFSNLLSTIQINQKKNKHFPVLQTS